MASAEAAQVTAVSDGEGGQGKSEVKVPDGRGEKRGDAGGGLVGIAVGHKGEIGVGKLFLDGVGVERGWAGAPSWEEDGATR